MQQKRLLLGLDPSFVKMGAAILNPETKQLILKSGEFQPMLKWINSNCKLSEVVAVVENPALDSTTFNMWGMVSKLIGDFVKYSIWQILKNGSPPKRVQLSDVQQQFAISMNHAQKVGENKAAAKLLIQMLSDKVVPFVEVAPSARDKAFKEDKNGNKRFLDVRFLKMPTKTTAEQFEQLTGYSGSSSYDSRDAATLIHGKTIKGVLTEIEINQAKNKHAPPSKPGSANNNYYLVNRPDC